MFHLGLRTRVQQVKTILSGQTQQNLGANLQENVGLIIGLSVYTDGVDPVNQALITTAQSNVLYLNLVHGDRIVIQNIKLLDLLNQQAGSNIIRPEKYTDVLIRGQDLQLNTSQYLNPTLIGAGDPTINTPCVTLNMWYIDITDYKRLVEHKVIKDPQRDFPHKEGLHTDHLHR